MLRVFQFVDQGNSIVFHGDATVVLVVGDQGISTEAEFSGSLAGIEVGGGAEAGPIDVAGAEIIEDLLMCPGKSYPFGRQVSGVKQGDSWRYKKTAGTSDDDKARAMVSGNGFGQTLCDDDELADVVMWRAECADDGVGALNATDDLVDARQVSLQNGESGAAEEVCAVSNDRGDLVVSIDGFFEDSAAGPSRSSV